MRESLLPPDHLDIVQSLNNLAALYNDGKDYEKAEIFYERALLIRKRVLPMDHPTVVASVRNLGFLVRGRGLACQQQKSRNPIGFYLDPAHPL